MQQKNSLQNNKVENSDSSLGCFNTTRGHIHAGLLMINDTAALKNYIMAPLCMCVCVIAHKGHL